MSEIVAITPKNQQSHNFLTSYKHERYEAYISLHEYRQQKYKNQKSLFEISETQLLNIIQTNLTLNDAKNLAITTADQWKEKIHQLIQTGQVKLTNPEFYYNKNKKDDFTNVDSYITLFNEDVEYNEETSTLTVYSLHDEEYTFKLNDSIPKEQIEFNLGLKLYYNQQPYKIEYTNPTETKNQQTYIDYEEEISEEAPSHPHPLMKTLAVYQDAWDIAHIENTPLEFEIPELFEQLGLWYIPVNVGYFIGKSPHKKQQAEEYLTKEDPTEEEYFNLFELPEYPYEPTDFVDAYSLEEHILYATQNAELNPQLFNYVPFLYYRPHPNTQSIKQALTLTKEYYDAIQNSHPFIQRIQGEDIQTWIDTYMKRKLQQIYIKPWNSVTYPAKQKEKHELL